MAVFTDEHALHIKEHSTVLSDPELRFDINLTNIVSNHIQEHIHLLQTTDPQILMALGQQPLPPPPPPQDTNAPPMPPQGGPQGQQMGPPPANGPQPPPQNVDQNAVKNNPMNQMLEQQGSPDIHIHLPKVDGKLLPNPALQDSAMGNVK